MEDRKQKTKPTRYDGSTSIVNLSCFLKFVALSYLGEKRIYVSGLILWLLEFGQVIVWRGVRRQLAQRGRRRHWRRHSGVLLESALVLDVDLLLNARFWTEWRRLELASSRRARFAEKMSSICAVMISIVLNCASKIAETKLCEYSSFEYYTFLWNRPEFAGQTVCGMTGVAGEEDHWTGEERTDHKLIYIHGLDSKLWRDEAICWNKMKN